MSIDRFFEWATGLGLNISPDQCAKFEQFQSALYEANQVMNLTGVPEEECWVRHFVDSLLFEDSFPLNATVLDIGSGPGFPAWPLACARPDLRVTALDSNGKMLGFLKTQPLENLKIVQARAEEWNRREKFDCVTGRALAPLPIQLEISVAACKVNGLLLPLRTPADDLQSCDLQALGLVLVEISSRRLPGTDVERVLPSYQKLHITHRGIPRRWPEIKSHPFVIY